MCEPYIVRTPAVRARSLMEKGRPCSGTEGSSGHDRALGLPGGGEGCLRRHRAEGVEGGVDPLDPIEDRPCDLHGRDLPGPDHLRQGGGGRVAKLGRVHESSVSEGVRGGAPAQAAPAGMIPRAGPGAGLQAPGPGPAYRWRASRTRGIRDGQRAGGSEGHGARCPPASVRTPHREEERNVRRSLRALVVVVAAALALPGLAVAETWVIDPAHTLSGFTVRHLMVTNVRGVLRHHQGKHRVHPGRPEVGQGRASSSRPGRSTRATRSGTTTSAPTTSSTPRSSRA